jgi:hypothetical protein
MDKIQILFHEYDTLRTEVIHRLNNSYQLVAVAGALLLWVVSNAKCDSGRFWVVLGISVLLVLAFGWLIYTDIKTISGRVRDLEKDINKRAGETLLVWETCYSPLSVGYVRYYFRRRKAQQPAH